MKVTPIVIDDCNSIVDSLGEIMRPLAGGTLLVTGANGFLCSYFVDCIVEWNRRHPDAKARVIAVDNLLTGSADRLAHLQGRDDVLIVSHDITKPLELAEKVDWVIHGASIASPMVYRKFPLETIDANVGGTRNMLDLAVAKKSRGVIVMSSSEIYGDPDPAFIPTSEDYRGNVACMGPRACYDESKRMSETLAWTYHRVHGLSVKLIRPFNVYGPGFRLDDQRVLPDLFTAVLDRKPIVMLSDGRPSRSFCYVTDAIRGILTVMVQGEGGEAYNVGNDEVEVSMADLAQRVSSTAAELMGGAASPVVFQTSTDSDYLTDNPQRRAPDLKKLRKVGGWTPTVSLVDGLKRTLTYYRELGLGQ
jgi:dTDP-glucose 4,6-dehydratase/UDP-glucuronate decarboxylase